MTILYLLPLLLVHSVNTQAINNPTNLNQNFSFTNTSTTNSDKNISKQSTILTVPIPIFPKAQLQKVGDDIQAKQQSTSIIDSLKLLTNILMNTKKQISVPVRSVESLLTKLPSQEQLEKLVQDGDIGGITSLLQILSGDDSIPCRIKLLYLVQLLQMTTKNSKRKTDVADELNFTITNTKQQISRIQQELKNKTQQKNQILISPLQKNLKNGTLAIADYYNMINSVEDLLKPQQAKIGPLQSQLDKLEKEKQLQLANINLSKLKLLQTQSLLADLNSKLSAARENRQRQLATIASRQNLIKQNLRGMDKIKSQTTQVRNKIKSLLDTQDSLQRQLNYVQIDVRRVRSDLSIAKTKDNKQGTTQKKYQSRIDEYQPYISDIFVSQVKDIVTNLNDSLPYINININRLYYYCYGLGSVKTQEKGSILVYVVKGESFGKYIQNAYAQVISVPRLAITDDLRLQLIQPNSQQWSAKYGYPSVPLNNNEPCPRNINYLPYQSSTGTIQKVSGNTIMVNGNDGNLFQLNMGQCTRLQSARGLPEIGQNIVWKGYFASKEKRIFNIQAATCW